MSERLLKGQNQVSGRLPMPVDVMDSSSSVSSYAQGACSLYYYNAGARTIDAGQAAGTVVDFTFNHRNIFDSLGVALACKDNTSLAFTCDALVTEVDATTRPQLASAMENMDYSTPAEKAASIGSFLATGEYVISYRHGMGWAKKATTTAAMSAVSYKISAATADPTASSSGGVGGGNNIWSNPQDFTATANAGAKTITLSVFASSILSAVLTSAHFSNAVIKKITSGGVVSSLPTTSVAYVSATGVLTLADMTANFAAGDTVVMMIPGPDKSYDETYDFNKTGDQFAPQYEDNTLGVAYGMRRPSPSATSADSSDVSAAAEASSVTKATAGRVYSVDFTNTNVAARFFQLFNSATVPADTAVPVLSFYVAAGQSIHLAWENGLYFSTGIAWANSSTGATKTIGAADSLANILYA